jgi:pyruvate kinase
MPLREEPSAVLERLGGLGAPLWIDLKGRQLRVAEAGIPPYTEVRLSHPIQVRTPVDAWFSDGHQRVRVAAVDGNRLILADGPRRLVGPGESVNIVDPSLRVEGTLTDRDREYLDALGGAGPRRVMLSYVETPADVEEVRGLVPGAEVVLKVENERGLALAREHRASLGRLCAARGDLYVEDPTASWAPSGRSSPRTPRRWWPAASSGDSSRTRCPALPTSAMPPS